MKQTIYTVTSGNDKCYECVCGYEAYQMELSFCQQLREMTDANSEVFNVQDKSIISCHII